MKFNRKKYKGVEYLEVIPKGEFSDDLQEMSLLVSRCLNMNVQRILMILPSMIDVEETYHNVGNHLIEKFGSYGLRLAFLLERGQLPDVDKENNPPNGRFEFWDFFPDKNAALEWLIKK